MKEENYTSVSEWIDRIIESCDISKIEQEKICDKLITNFTNQILGNQNYKLYHKIEKKLRRKLISKFYNKEI